jgi:hypothetical protein
MGPYIAPPHVIFVNSEKTVRSDNGQPVNLLDFKAYGARSECLICGLPIECTFWPPREGHRDDWRHVV